MGTDTSGLSRFPGTHRPILRRQEFLETVFIFIFALKNSGNTIDNQASSNHLIYCICTCVLGAGRTNTNYKPDQQLETEGGKTDTLLDVFLSHAAVIHQILSFSFLLSDIPLLHMRKLFSFLHVFNLKNCALELCTRNTKINKTLL